MSTDVINFLRNSEKGKIKYDRYWKEEGRTEMILNEISAHITRLSVSPKAMALILESPNSDDKRKSLGAGDEPSPAKSPNKTNSLSFDIDDKPDIYMLTAISESELPLLEYEEERRRMVMEKVERKRAEVDARLKELEQQTEQQCQLLKWKCELEIMRKNAEVQRLHELNCKEAQQKDIKEKELHSTHAKRISARKMEAEMKQKQAEEELRRREKEQEEMKQHLTACQKELHSCIRQTKAKLDMCAHKFHLEISSDERHNLMADILQRIDQIVEGTFSKGVEMEELKTAQTLLEDAQIIYQSVTADTEQAKNKALLESELSRVRSKTIDSDSNSRTSTVNSLTPAASKESELRRRLNFEENVESQHLKSKQTGSKALETGEQKSHKVTRSKTLETEEQKSHKVTEVNRSNTQTSSMEPSHNVPLIDSRQARNVDFTPGHNMEESTMKDDKLSALYTYVACDAFEEYTQSMNFLDHWTNTCKPFTSDPRNKNYNFCLMKAVNTPVNVLSGKSGSHVRDKMERILVFLGGGAVEVLGKRITCKEHPLALQYSMSILAQQFVNQGEGQVSSHFAAAFPIATAIVGIWTHYPDVGSLILSYFYKKCPYLVPFYPPKKKGQSEIEYYKSLGYQCIDGTVEEKNKFLKRMSGFMRLYAAIIQSPLPPGCKGPHPHGIAWGWKWLSRVLNLEPRQDITATLLFDFLDVLGNALQKTYGKQFQKLLHALCKDYFKKIEEVTSTGSGGPLSRLEEFLQKAIKSRCIALPEGALPPDFFRT